MAVKIRLARRGRKKLAMYDIVVSDARAPRDGRFIEKIGTYNPNTNPATVNLNDAQALKWLMNGAQPTDTANGILSQHGVLLKKHLQVGVIKGAITQDQADAKFEAWKKEKDAKVQANLDSISKGKAKAKATRLEAESKVSATRAEGIAAKNKAADDAVVASVVEAIQEAEEEATGVEITEVEVEVEPEVAAEPAVEDAPATEESEAPAADASEESAE